MPRILRRQPFAVLLFVLIAASSAMATHPGPCTPSQADPATVVVIPISASQISYIEERDVPEPLKTYPPTPFSGAFFGNGTWIYEESGHLPGLQRGANGCFDQTFIFCSESYVMDEDCGHGRDSLFWTSEYFPHPTLWPLPLGP